MQLPCKGCSTPPTKGVPAYMLKTTDLPWRRSTFCWCRPETTANQMLDLVLWLAGFWSTLNSQPPKKSPIKVRWLIGERTGCCELTCAWAEGPGAGASSLKHWGFITRGLSTGSRNSPPVLLASLPTSLSLAQVSSWELLERIWNDLPWGRSCPGLSSLCPGTTLTFLFASRPRSRLQSQKAT